MDKKKLDLQTTDLPETSGSGDQETSDSSPEHRTPIWVELGYQRPPKRRIKNPPVIFKPPTSDRDAVMTSAQIADSYDEDEEDSDEQEQQQHPLIMETIEHDEPEQACKSEHDSSNSTPARYTPPTGSRSVSPEGTVKRARMGSPFKPVDRASLGGRSRAATPRSERSWSPKSEHYYTELFAYRARSLARDVEEEQESATAAALSFSPVAVSEVKPELQGDGDEIAGAEEAIQPVVMNNNNNTNNNTGKTGRYLASAFFIAAVMIVLVAVIYKMMQEK